MRTALRLRGQQGGFAREFSRRRLESVSQHAQTEDGEVAQSNPDTVGYLIYTDDGHMAYLRTLSVLSAFSDGDDRGGTPAEKIAAFDNFLGYCGTYDVRDNTVVHHVETSMLPNWVGTDQVRTFTLSGDELRVVTAPFVRAGKMQTITLVFQRASRT